MKEKDFDKVFSDKLLQDRHLTFEEKEWDILSKRLNDSDSIKASLNNAQQKYWRWLLPLLLLLLGFNAWILSKMNTTQYENAALIEQVKQVKTLLEKQNTTSMQSQILYKTDTVVVYKTLYKTIYKDASIPFPTPNIGQSISATTLMPAASSRQGVTVFEPNSIPNKGINNQNTSQNVGETSISKEKQADIALLKNEANTVVNHIPTLGLPSIIAYTAKPELIVLKENKNIIQPILSTKNRLYVGWSAGLINYHTQWFNKDNIEFSRNEKSYQTGLKAELSLNNNWRITAAADYCPYDFQINWQDKRYNLPAPSNPVYLTLPYTFKSVAGTQKMYLGSVGIKYLFEGTWLRPYLGVSYAAMRMNPYEATYTYADSWKTYSSTGALHNALNVLNIAHLQGGLEFKIGKKILFQTDGFYYKDINKVEKTFDLFGLRGAVLYGF
jgi:hypothetical protein